MCGYGILNKNYINAGLSSNETAIHGQTGWIIAALLVVVIIAISVAFVLLCRKYKHKYVYCSTTN